MKNIAILALLGVLNAQPAHADLSAIEYAQAENFADTDMKMMVAIGIVCKLEGARTLRIAFLESAKRSGASDYQIKKLDSIVMSDVHKATRCPVAEDRRDYFEGTLQEAIAQLEAL